MSFLIIGALAFAYLQFGYRIVGRAGWRIWHLKRSSGLLPWLLFPVSRNKYEMGKDAFLADDKALTEGGYCRVMAFIWPLKAAWTACALAFFVIYGAGKLMLRIGDALFFSGPDKLVRMLFGKNRTSILDAPIIVNWKLVERHKFGKEFRKELEEIDDELDLEGKFRKLEASEIKDRSS